MSLSTKTKKIRKKKKEAKKSKKAKKASTDASNSQSPGKINPITGMTTEAEIKTLSEALAGASNLSKDDAASFLKQAQGLRDKRSSGQPISKSEIASFTDSTGDMFKKLEDVKGFDQLKNPFTMTESEKNQQVEQLAQAMEKAVKVPSDNTQKMLKDTYALIDHLTNTKGDRDSADGETKDDSDTNASGADYQTLLNNFKDSYSQHYDALGSSEAGFPIGGHLFNMTKDELDAEIKDINKKIADARKLPPEQIHEFVRDAYALREKLFEVSKSAENPDSNDSSTTEDKEESTKAEETIDLEVRDKNSPEDQVAKNEVNREIGEFNQKHAGTMEEIVRASLK
ncbi:hypothetical protein [Moorena producens]|uniref:hypothetical protein n=1 Tax=Moorena producens TaxID=1155739 RepID=UPI003C711B96